MTPVLGSLFEYKPINQEPKTIDAMMHTTFCGCVLLSTVFLSGKSSNYLLFNMLTGSQALPNGWLSWLFFASFTGFLLVIAFFLIHVFYFRSPSYPNISRFTLLKTIGKFPANGKQEYTCISMLGLLFSGWLLMHSLGLPTKSISIFIIILPLCTGSRKLRDLSNMVNWPFICYLIAMEGTMNLIQARDIFSTDLPYYSMLADCLKDPFICLVGIFIFSWLLNLLLGTLIAPALAFTLLTPLLHSSPVHLWIIIFTILMATEAWIFPYQSSYFILFRTMVRNYPQCNTGSLIKTNVCMALVKFFVLLASIPFWKAIGIYP